MQDRSRAPRGSGRSLRTRPDPGSEPAPRRIHGSIPGAAAALAAVLAATPVLAARAADSLSPGDALVPVPRVAPGAAWTHAVPWPSAPPSDPWEPVALLTLPTGHLVIADRAQNRLFSLSAPEAKPVRLPSPSPAAVEWTALAAAPGLSFYALDGPGRAVHQYDFAGNYVGTAADLAAAAERNGLGPVDPAGLAVDGSGLAVVTDRLGDRLLVFGPTWELTGIWGETGSRPGAWRRPAGIAVGPRGPYLVIDAGNRRVVLVDELGAAVGVRVFEEEVLGVAALEPSGFVLVFEGAALQVGPALETRATVPVVPWGPCREPFATGAVAGRGKQLWLGEGCSGRVHEYRPERTER